VIQTSYFRKPGLPADRCVAISLTVPRGYHGRRYLDLAPSRKLLQSYQFRWILWEEYAFEYRATVLHRLDPMDVGSDLVTLKGLGYENYNRIHNGRVPPGCRLTECPCYALALDYDGIKVPVCTDRKCWRRLETAATRATNKATKADVADKMRREIPEAVARITRPAEPLEHVRAILQAQQAEAPPITSRELAVVAFYALREIGGQDRETAFPEIATEFFNINQQKALLALAALPPAALIARTVEAILRAEQAGRLKDYSNIGTHASEFYLGRACETAGLSAKE
jgi:hypothetical protein